MVLGHGAGEIAAAQAAGVLGLEDSLRLVAASDGSAAPEGVTLDPPSLTLLSVATGREVTAGEALDAAYWCRQAQAKEPEALARCVGTLADVGVNTVVDIGPNTELGPKLSAAWPQRDFNDPPPTVVASLRRPPADGSEAAVGRGSAFMEAVAGVYEAGLAVSFTGLFAGETRRRISLPGYPFQRRRHWIKAPKRQDAASPS